MLAVLLLLAASAEPASQPASQPAATAAEGLERTLAAIEPKLQNLNASYLKTEVFDREGSVRQRVSDGEILYLLGDYERASVVLFDVVSEPKNQSQPLYDRALYFLGESCFQTRNFVGARAHFQTLISRADKTFLFDAFERLIAIAEALQDWSGVEEKVKEMRDAGHGVLRPDVAYLYGKSLSMRDLGEEAMKQLEQLPEDHKYFYRARYVIGSELVKAKKLDQALDEFAKVVQAKFPAGLGADERDQALLREVASLAMARVNAEQGRTDEAMTSYAAVGRESPYLAQSLYEIAWMYVQQAQYATLERDRARYLRKALQAIDIMLLSQDDQVLVPKATILKGNVLLKLDRFEDAVDAYKTVAKKFEPVYKELELTLRDVKDPTQYFNEVIAKNQGTYNASAFLPPLAVNWVSEEREVNRALGVAHDLAAGDFTTAEAKVIGGKVLGALQTRRPIELFPLFKEGEEKAVALELEVRKATEQLLAQMTQALAGHIDAATREKLLKAQTARIKAQAALAEAAFKREESKRIENKHLQLVADLERKALRLRTDITSMNAQLVAVAKWLADNKSNPDLRAEQLAELKSQMDLENGVIISLEREENALHDELQRARTSSGGPVTNEQRARDDYAFALSTEMKLLIAAREKAQLPSTGALRRLDVLRDRVGSLDAGLRSFRDQLATTIDRKTIQIANAVEAELRVMEEYQKELDVLEGEAESLVGGVAASSFENVKRRFHDIVIKADVGSVDVAWRRKEERSQAINELVRTQKDALESLDRQFKELAEEVKK